MTMCIIIHVIYYMFCKSNNLIQSIIPCTRTFVKKIVMYIRNYLTLY